MRLYILLFASILLFQNISFACQASDADCIYLSSITVTGTDNVVICNSCATDITLSGGVMIVDNDPDNVETLADTTIPSLGCVTLTQGVDFDFGFSGGNGDGFMLTCADGSVIIDYSFPGGSEGTITVQPEPLSCSVSGLADLTITGVNLDDDFVVVCNNTCDDVVLSGAAVGDSGGPDGMLFNTIVPGAGCITLENFNFGLGGTDSFSIGCGGGELTESWDTSEDELAFVSDCDAAASSIYIYEVVASDPDGNPDNVTICNNSDQLVSLHNAIVSDEIDDAASGDGDALSFLTIAPYGCITLVRGVDFDFGIGSDEEFVIYCEDAIYSSIELGGEDSVLSGIPQPSKPVAGIPTMGEWGLVSLALLLMIIGVARIKEPNYKLA